MLSRIAKLASSAALVGALALPSVASSSTFLNNWYLDLDADGNKVQVNEYLDFTGNSYIQLTPAGGNNFTFADNGFFQVTGRDGMGINTHWLGAGQPRDLTALFSGGTGTGTFGGPISFTGGLLELFSDANFDYASTTGAYGTNNGTKIGSFTLVEGSGFVDPTGVPNGLLTLVFQATELAAGYWFGPDGMTDLSTLIGQDLLFGFVTTNATVLENPNTTLVAELGEMVGIGNIDDVVNDPDLGSFIVSNNGQYRTSIVPGTVPEPGVLALLGLGMLGACAGMRARRKS